MTAEVADLDYGAGAWRRICNGTSTTLQDRRAAAVYAAQCTAEDANWLTFERSARIYDSIPRLAALPDIDAAWADLVAACKGGWGPLMLRAVEALVYGTGQRQR